MKRGLAYLVGFALIGAVGALLFFPVFSQSREKARVAAQLAYAPPDASGAAFPGAPPSPMDPLAKTAYPAALPSSAAGPGAAVLGGTQLLESRMNRVSRPSAAPAAVPAARQPVRDPNLYVSSTYIGGSGAKDRLETLIRNGVVVAGKRVKVEAFSRGYAQAFPIPTRTALHLVAATERGKIVPEGDRTYLQVGLQAMQGEAPRRPPLNVALVIDCSGSMAEENKLDYARAAAIHLIDRLRPDDILSIVSFDDSARLLFPAQRVGNGTKARSQIAALTPGSGTNIYDGLQSGYQEARKHVGRERVSRVLLLSDGQVTAGVTDPLEFQRRAAAEVDREIQTTTVGMGVAFNEDLMLAIAREGKGNYHFLKDGADTRKVFAQELEELTHIVARAVRVRIRLAEGVGLVRVLGAAELNTEQTRAVKAEERKIDRKVYEELGIAANRQKDKEEPGIKLLIPAFYRGDHHVVMLEVAVPRGRGTRPVAEVFLKYKDLVARANRETKATVTVESARDRAEMVASINRNVKKNLLGFQTGEALTEAASLISQGHLADAVRKIDERMVVLGLAAREWRDRDLERDGQLLDRYKTVLAQLREQPRLADAEFGQYLRKSLTYSGYQLTR